MFSITQLTAKRVLVVVLVLFLLNWILMVLYLKSIPPQQVADFYQRQKYAELLLFNPLFLVADVAFIAAGIRWVIKAHKTPQHHRRRMLVVALISGNLGGYLLL